MEGEAKAENLPRAAEAARTHFIGGALLQLLCVHEATFWNASWGGHFLLPQQGSSHVGGKSNDWSKFLKESPNGGVWIIKIKRDDNIDKMWESTCFALIGKLQFFSEFLSWWIRWAIWGAKRYRSKSISEDERTTDLGLVEGWQERAHEDKHFEQNAPLS